MCKYQPKSFTIYKSCFSSCKIMPLVLKILAIIWDPIDYPKFQRYSLPRRRVAIVSLATTQQHMGPKFASNLINPLNDCQLRQRQVKAETQLIHIAMGLTWSTIPVCIRKLLISGAFSRPGGIIRNFLILELREPDVLVCMASALWRGKMSKHSVELISLQMQTPLDWKSSSKGIVF